MRVREEVKNQKLINSNYEFSNEVVSLRGCGIASERASASIRARMKEKKKIASKSSNNDKHNYRKLVFHEATSLSTKLTSSSPSSSSLSQKNRLDSADNSNITTNNIIKSRNLFINISSCFNKYICFCFDCICLFNFCFYCK